MFPEIKNRVEAKYHNIMHVPLEYGEKVIENDWIVM